MMLTETPLSRQFSIYMRHLDTAMDPSVEWAARLACLMLGEGRVCLDLEEWAQREVAPGERLPQLADWKKSLETSALVGRPGEFKPLILEGCRLYLARYWLYETRLAEGLARLAGQECPEVEPADLGANLDRLFQGNTGEDPDWQKIAAAIAVLRKLCVISGGPGTGKTTTVVRILAALQLQAEGKLRIVLSAPTGKAAGRMQDSVQAQKKTLALPDEIADSIPENAATLHRLLGGRPDSAYFHYGRDKPLPADVVVVDEASMIDLALMAKLIDALAPKARLILLGDKDQLAAVEAGAVFGDICAGRDRTIPRPVTDASEPFDLSPSSGPAGHLLPEGEGNKERTSSAGSRASYSRPFLERLSQATGVELIGFDAEDAKALGDSIALLVRSHRFGEGSGIGQLARGVYDERSDRTVIELLRGGRHEDIAWRSQFADKDLLERLERGYRPFFEAVNNAADDKGVLSAFNRFRALTAHREGSCGAATVNRAFDASMRARLRLPLYERWYPGRPVIVTRNDYSLRLFNGDVGVCLLLGGEFRVCFEAANGKIRSFSPARLPEHEPVYAMTVHKSQGSEFDEVLLLLPEAASPVLNRPLIYTAVTRARRRVEIWGSEEILAAGVRRTPERGSGLRERLWGRVGSDG